MTLNFEKKGTGKNQILFVHGNSQSLEYWNEVITHLSTFPGYSFISVDLPGHGKSFRSEKPEIDYLLKNLGTHLAGFIKENVHGEYIIVTNSLGANVVSEVTEDLGGCKGFMLVGSTAVGKGLAFADLIKPNPNIAAVFMAHPAEEEIDLLIEEAAYGISADQKLFIKNVFKATDPAFRQTLADSAGEPQNDELQNFENSNLPIAIVYGKEEKLCFTEVFEKIEFKKWKNQIFLIPQSGHCSQFDQPEKLAVLVKQFANDCFK